MPSFGSIPPVPLFASLHLQRSFGAITLLPQAVAKAGGACRAVATRLCRKNAVITRLAAKKRIPWVAFFAPDNIDNRLLISLRTLLPQAVAKAGGVCRAVATKRKWSPCLEYPRLQHLPAGLVHSSSKNEEARIARSGPVGFSGAFPFVGNRPSGY